MDIWPADWSTIFAMEQGIAEQFVRGTILYWGLLLLLRVMPRRSGGDLSTMDLIFALLIAEAAAHAMGDYSSVTDGLILVAVMMAWNYAINALSYRIGWFERLVSSPPLLVIRDGQLLLRNMRREFLTKEELLSHLREQGIDDVGKVKSACIETDGRISVVPVEGRA